MNESPTQLRAELLKFWESRDKNLVPLVGWPEVDCGYEPPRVTGGEEDFIESLAEIEAERTAPAWNAGMILAWCALGLFWCAATAAVVAIWR